MPDTESQDTSLQEKYESALLEITTLKEQLGKSNNKSRSRSRRRSISLPRSRRSSRSSTKTTDNESANIETSDASEDERNTRITTRRSKNTKIKHVLGKHQKAIKKLAKKTVPKGEENDDLRQLINGLSNQSILDAVRNSTLPNFPNNPNHPIAPKLRTNHGASVQTLRDTITSLKDLYRNQFQGRDNEDIDGLLRSASQLAEEGKLSEKNFYQLLKSRVQMGSVLYSEISHHEKTNSSLRTLFNELVPLYSNTANYLTNLRALNEYKPPSGTPANQVLAHIKMLVTNLAGSSNATDKTDFILSHTRDKVLATYPNIAPSIIERELTNNATTMASFSKIFLNLSPSIDKNKLNNKVNETKETSLDEPLDFKIEIIPEKDTIHTIRLSSALATQLKDKCFKCGDTSKQDKHYARNCDLYRGSPLAYYLCLTCKKGVHLPRDCKYQPDDEINSIQIEIIPDNQIPKNAI
jgi:hypothetical protein